MQFVSHGIDLIECERIARVLENHGKRFLDRVLTVAEQERAEHFADPIPFIAGRFAAKEAILKMIGTGWRGEIAWTDMEILPNELGQPIVRLCGATARRAEAIGINRVNLSITHTKNYAAASAIGLRAN
ncbi:MAG: holo-ACP synthase [Planctomycetes bacterium]|nr:holo-ACP synthase [Planctomycetota bacterium]MBI3835514.1 holo-ACP synthase [Planctomycetota bacterium]